MSQRNKFFHFTHFESNWYLETYIGISRVTVLWIIMYSKFWNVVRMLLVLSHGQAAVSVERGFSINKQAEEVHLQAVIM